MPLMRTWAVATSPLQFRVPANHPINGYLLELPKKYSVEDVARFRILADGVRVIHECTGPECAKFAAADGFKLPDGMVGAVARHFNACLAQWQSLCFEVEGIQTLDMSSPITDGDYWRLWSVVL